MSSTVDEIAIKLGIQKGDLKAALADSNAEIKAFGEHGSHDVGALTEAIHETHKAMRLFHQFLMAGGLVEAFKEIFEKGISYAEKHKDLMDENTQATRRFGETLKTDSDLIGSLLNQVIGFAARAGEGWAELYTAITIGSEKAHNAQEINEAAEENLKKLAEARKDTIKEIARLTDEAAAKEVERGWADFEALGIMEKMELLEGAIVEGLEKASHLEEQSLEFQKTKRDVLEYQSKLIKLAAEDEKETAKRQEEAVKKEFDDITKLHEKQIKNTKEAAILLLKGKENLTAVEKEQLKLLQGQTTEAAQQVETQALYQKLLEGTILPGEKERLKVLVGQTDEAKKQHAEAQATVDVWLGYKDKVNQTGGSVNALSDAQLEALRRKLAGQISEEEVNTLPQNRPYNFALQQYQASLYSVNEEQQLRSKFRGTVDFFGSGYAETHFDPAVFDRLSSMLDPAQQTRQAKSIDAIAGTLKNLFPAQYSGSP